MLSRVLEPEVMDTPEQASAYDAMDHSEVNRRFVDDVLAAWAERSDELRARRQRPFAALRVTANGSIWAPARP